MIKSSHLSRQLSFQMII